jgi:transposase InsO family protein
VSVRTLWTWQRHDPGRVGRPPHSAAARRRALRQVARAWRGQGRGAGWRTVEKALPPAVPTRLVQSSLRACKRRHARRAAAHRARVRVSTQVHARDALWALDATHLGRVHGTGIEGQVARDAASRRTTALSVGRPATGADVVALLEAARRQRSALPLVLSTDNGSPYRSALVRDYLETHQVLQLFSLPRTPQHNAVAERGIGELKVDSGLGKGVALPDAETAAHCLQASVLRLDHVRLRACLGYRTAAQADAALSCADALVDRARLFEVTRCAIGRAVLGCRNARERRRAERNTILAALDLAGLTTRRRGGEPLPLVKPEVFS